MRSESSKTHIRPMVADDLPRILQIAASLPHAPQWPVATYQTALRPDSVPRRIALVAEQGDGMGFAIAAVIAGEAELEMIAVAEAVQRRGIGRQLLEKLTEALKNEQIAALHLEARASNHAALALYRSAGFADMGRRANYYSDPQDDAVLMSLKLNNIEPIS